MRRTLITLSSMAHGFKPTASSDISQPTWNTPRQYSKIKVIADHMDKPMSHVETESRDDFCFRRLRLRLGSRPIGSS